MLTYLTNYLKIRGEVSLANYKLRLAYSLRFFFNQLFPNEV